LSFSFENRKISYDEDPPKRSGKRATRLKFLLKKLTTGKKTPMDVDVW